MKQYTNKQIKLITNYFQQGQQLIQLADFIKAEQAYLEILKIAPEIEDARNALAYIYTVSKQHSKAIKQLEQLLKLNNSNANTHHNLANNFTELHSYEKAIEHYLTAINLNPNLIDAYIQCGFAYKKLQHFQLALQYLNQALTLNGSSTKALHLIGSVYAEIRSYSEAIKYFSQAISLAPNNREYQLHYAQAFESANLLREADIQYHRICTIFPDYLDAFLAYGDLLVKNRYFDQALECFGFAASLAPENTDILDDLGSVYLELSDTKNAIDNFNLALAKEPNRMSSLVGLYQAFKETGKLEQAISICDQLICLFDNNPTGYLLKARVKKATKDDNNTTLLTKFLESEQLGIHQRIDIHFTLGKIYDDQNLYDLSFSHYTRGNALIDENIQYNKKDIESFFNQLIEVFDASFFERYSNLGNDSDLPIVIIGMPRSGTTLTEQIISSHPMVLAAGEVTYWGDVTRKLNYLGEVKLNYPSCIHKTLPAHAPTISSQYLLELSRITSNSKLKHITDKMPQNFINLGLIALFFPNAKIIHTKRDAIDTCLSIFFQNFKESHTYAFNLDYIGHYYTQYLRLMEHWHKVLPGRILDINYADTVSDPEYWSRKLISYIGLEWDDACLAPHKLERTVKTASHWQVRQPIYQTSIQRWKSYEHFLQPLINTLNG